MGWFKHHLEPKLTGPVGASEKILVMKISKHPSSESGKIICDVHQVGGAFWLVTSTKMLKNHGDTSFLLLKRPSSWGFPVAVMQLLDCSCAPALDPWSKKMKRSNSAVSGTSGVQFFLEAGVFYRLEWLDDRGMVTKRANFTGFEGSIMWYLSLVPKGNSTESRGRTVFQWKIFLNKHRIYPWKQAFCPPKGKGGCLPTIHFRGELFQGGYILYMIGLLKLETRQSKENPKFCRLGHLMKLPELGRSWKNVIGWNYPPTLDAIVTTRIMNHF